jgi:tetratricopeptide (TPR) repeat protein
VGSGVIIHRQGNTYTIVTNRHVLCGGNRCDTLPASEIYTLKLADGQQQRINPSSIKIFENNLDLAIIQIQSDKLLQIAPVAKELPQVDSVLYTAGFPADEHFIIGFNKFVDPGKNFLAGKQQAIAEFDTAIQLNPKYSTAYFSRACTYEQLGKFDLAGKDYTQAIAIEPKFPEAYTNLGLIKLERFNDIQGALADYNQAIAIDPQYSDAYNNRGLLQADKLNKPQTALAD